MSQLTAFIGSDHGGYVLKQQILDHFSHQHDTQIQDCGAFQLDPEDDYPQFAAAVAEHVANTGEQAKGIVLCRSGGGVIIVANKVPGVRAVLVRTVDEVAHAVQHNDANVIGIAADWTSTAEAQRMVELFLRQSFSGEERHQRRIAQIRAIEHKYIVSK